MHVTFDVCLGSNIAIKVQSVSKKKTFELTWWCINVPVMNALGKAFFSRPSHFLNKCSFLVNLIVGIIDVFKWKRFLHYWPIAVVREFIRSLLALCGWSNGGSMSYRVLADKLFNKQSRFGWFETTRCLWTWLENNVLSNSLHCLNYSESWSIKTW